MLRFLIDHASSFWAGLLVSLELTFSSLLLGLFFAILAVILRQARRLFWLNWPVSIFFLFLRSTPLLVQIYLVYYGFGQFEWIRQSLFWPILQNPSYCAIWALGLNSAAYTSVIIQGAIRAIPRGEIEAGKALGLSSRQLIFGVLGKRALLQLWPNYSNEIIMIFKATAIASTITVLELMGLTRQLISETFQITDCLVLAGAIYLITTYVLTLLLKGLAKLWIPQASRGS